MCAFLLLSSETLRQGLHMFRVYLFRSCSFGLCPFSIFLSFSSLFYSSLIEHCLRCIISVCNLRNHVSGVMNGFYEEENGRQLNWQMRMLISFNVCRLCRTIKRYETVSNVFAKFIEAQKCLFYTTVRNSIG